MKIDIARQPLVPAFVTLFALAVTAMWGGAGDGVSADAPETMPLLGHSEELSVKEAWECRWWFLY